MRDENSDYELPHYTIEQANRRYLAMGMLKIYTGLDIPIPLDAEITYIDDGSVFYKKA